MLGVYFTRRLLLLFPSCSSSIAVDSSVTHVFTRLCSSHSLLSNTQVVKDSSFTVSYFINSLGFSPQLALSLSKKSGVHFGSPKKPDSVIKLLKHYGLTDLHVSQIVKRCPVLLTFNAEKNLLPKLEFLVSVGIKGTALARLLCTSPDSLRFSLNTSLRPCYDITKTLGIPVEKLPFMFGYHKVRSLSIVAGNIPVLKAYNVPRSSFPLWNNAYFYALALDSEKVKSNIEKVISMGFNPSSATFMKALYVITVTDASKWEQKVKFYGKWGWTEDDVLLAFRRSPLFMAFSQKIISAKLDYYMNTMGCQTSDVAGCPDLLMFSLEKRIIPRCSVIRLLRSKGLIAKEDMSMITILQHGEKLFLERFVIKYQDEVPEFLSILRGKVTLVNFGLGLYERDGVKQY